MAETRLNKYGDENYGLFGSESYKNNIIDKFYNTQLIISIDELKNIKLSIK